MGNVRDFVFALLILICVSPIGGEEQTIYPRAKESPKFASYEWGATKDEILKTSAKEGFKWDDEYGKARGDLLGKEVSIQPFFSESGVLKCLYLCWTFHVDEAGKRGPFFDRLHKIINKKYGDTFKEKGKPCKWLPPVEIESDEWVLKLEESGLSVTLFYRSPECVEAITARKNAEKRKAKEQEKDF